MDDGAIGGWWGLDGLLDQAGEAIRDAFGGAAIEAEDDAKSSSVRAGRRAIRRWRWPIDISPNLRQIWPVVKSPISWPLRRI